MGARLRSFGVITALAILLGACSSGTPAGSRPAPAATAPAASAPAAPAAPGAPAAAPAAPPQIMTVKIGTTPSISNGARYIALERGDFREAGIEMEDVHSDTSAQILPSLAAGQIEIAGGGISAALFNAIAQGIPVRLVLDQWTAYPGNGAGGLIVRKDLVDSGQVRDFADLRGLKIGITAKGQATEYGLATGLAKAGLTLADVETTLMPYPDMTVALGNRNIDGANTIEPYGELAVAQGFALAPVSEATSPQST